MEPRFMYRKAPFDQKSAQNKVCIRSSLRKDRNFFENSFIQTSMTQSFFI